MKISIVFFLCIVLLGCGGEGGGSSTGSTPTSDRLEDPIIDPSINYSFIQGVHDANYRLGSGEVDINVIYIDSQGLLKAYNYLNDGVDKGADCYREASGAEVNALYSRKRLRYDDNTRQFRVSSYNGSAFDIVWEYDQSGNIIQIYYGSVSSNYRIQSLSGSSDKVSVSVYKSNLTSSDLLSKLCN